MNEIELIEQKDLREQYIERIDVLDKVKELLLLPSTDLATTQQVADYYEVNVNLIHKIFVRHKDELIEDGCKILNGKEIKKILRKDNIKITSYRGHFNVENQKISNGFNRIFSIKAILKISMYLTDSTIAKKVRNELSIHNSKLYNELLNGHRLRFKRYEQQYYDYLCFSFGKEDIQKQVKCGQYIIDFVLFDKIAIEIDENGHDGYNKSKEVVREQYIYNNGYLIVRHNPHKQQPYELIENIIKVLDKHLEEWAS